MRNQSTIVSVLVVAALMVLLSSCGNNHGCGPDTGDCGPDLYTGSHSDIDDSFIAAMKDSLAWQADVAALAIDRTENPDVLEIAEQMDQILPTQIGELEGWMHEWDIAPLVYSQRPVAGAMSLPYMAPDPDYVNMHELSGLEFDLIWLPDMISRGQNIIEMAERVIDEGEHQAVADFASNLIGSHQRWLDTLTAIQDQFTPCGQSC